MRQHLNDPEQTHRCRGRFTYCKIITFTNRAPVESNHRGVFVLLAGKCAERPHENEEEKANMNTNGNHKLVESLARIWAEWEEAADGLPLIVVEGSVGLILADLAESVGLDQEEMLEALGDLAELV